MLKGKNVILGVTGGIAAYKIVGLASALVKQGASVNVLMTEAATHFITQDTFEAITKNKAIVDTFDRNFEYEVEHIALAKKADIFLVAPATANTIAKLAHGIADNMLTTTFLACTCPKMVAPAMNTEMYNNEVTQENMDKLESMGVTVIPADSGRLACGDTGIGKMPEPELLLSYIEKEIAREKDMEGMHVLVTAGATKEPLDPVRFITNHSTGKMGFAIAKECMLRGAKVVLCKASTSSTLPEFVDIIDTPTSAEMFEACKRYGRGADFIIKAAAVSDYRPAEVSENKMKKKDGDLSINLERTVDILKYLGEHKSPSQVICGFSMETENLIENSTAKLHKKNADLIVANNLKDSGAGFGTDTNLVTLITKEGYDSLELLTKADVARKIIDKLIEISKVKHGELPLEE